MATAVSAPQKRRFFGWWVAIGCIISFSTMASLGTFGGSSFPQLSKEFGWTAAHLGIMMGFQAFTGVLWSPLAGWICDRIGSRKAIFILITEEFIAVMLYPLVTQFWQMFLLWPILTSLGGIGAVWVGLMSLPRKWFIKRAGMVSGFIGAFWGLVSALVFPAVTALGSSIGWRAAIFYIVPVLYALTVIIVYFWIWDSPEKKGLNPDGLTDEEFRKFKTAVSAKEEAEPCMTRGEALKSPQFWLLSIGFGLTMDEAGVIQGQSVLMAGTYGIPVALSGTVMSALMLPAILGRGGIGLIGDKWGRRRTILIFAVIAALNQFAGWILVHDPRSLYIFMATLGLTMMGGMTLFPPLYGDLFGRKYLSSIFGVGFGISSLISGLITILAGYIRTGTGSYNWVFFMLGVNFILQLVLIQLIRPTRVQIANAAMAGRPDNRHDHELAR